MENGIKTTQQHSPSIRESKLNISATRLAKTAFQIFIPFSLLTFSMYNCITSLKVTKRKHADHVVYKGCDKKFQEVKLNINDALPIRRLPNANQQLQLLMQLKETGAVPQDPSSVRILETEKYRCGLR